MPTKTTQASDSRQPSGGDRTREFCPSYFTGTNLAENDPEVWASGQMSEGMSMARITRLKNKPAPSVHYNEKVKPLMQFRRWRAAWPPASQAYLMNHQLERDEMPYVLPICFGILRDKERMTWAWLPQSLNTKRRRYWWGKNRAWGDEKRCDWS